MPLPDQKTTRNRILAALSPEDFGLLAPNLEAVRLELREFLAEANEPIRHVYFPERGIASVLASAEEGKIEVGIIGREGMVGVPVVLGTDRSPYGFLVQQDGEALRIAVQDLEAALAQSPTMMRMFSRYLYAFMVQVAQTAYANASFTIEARLARWILMTRDRSDSDELTLTHDFLAMMLGVRRPGVTVATHVLEGAQMIRANRGRITILDREKLQDLAHDSYGVAEAEYGRVMALA